MIWSPKPANHMTTEGDTPVAPVKASSAPGLLLTPSTEAPTYNRVGHSTGSGVQVGAASAGEGMNTARAPRTTAMARARTPGRNLRRPAVGRCVVRPTVHFLEIGCWSHPYRVVERAAAGKQKGPHPG